MPRSNLRKAAPPTAPRRERYDALKKYSRLTQAARDGKLDPVIGRDEKSAAPFNALASDQKIIRSDCEPASQDRDREAGAADRQCDVRKASRTRSCWRSTSRVDRRAKYRGEFEERLKAVLQK